MSRSKKALIISAIVILFEILLLLSFPFLVVIAFNFLFLALAAIPVWLFGMIFPQKVIWWGNEDNRNRKKVSKYAGIQLLLCFIIAIVIIPKTEDQTLSAAAPSPSPAPAATTKSVVTEEPGVSRNTLASIPTQKPVPTKKPVTTTKPKATNKPVTTTKPKATNKPVTTTKPKATNKPAATKAPVQDVYYKNCDSVRAAGADPIRAGEPGYSRKLDRDGDGVGCE
ncbi:excalibur calcium-binding domain-containing protein [Paenibacillus sp. FSL P4-0081]|uniref:excalibur calcium-binding domain-containing protein n=1 Tax=Paenibacillus sp. FSL P4-0081 TaxID=1536769 RepID=UPI000694F059